MGGYRIATIRGIPIRVHITFLIALPLIAFGFGRAFIAAAQLAGIPPERLSGSPWLWGLGVAVVLFASVLVHELAHSLYALRTGGRVRDITLLMVGGVSQLTEPPKKVKDEAVMALVGPLVSLALGVAFLVLRLAVGGASFNLQFALFYLGSLNLFLGLFNLLPAFPMDGGRILRALLSGRMGMVRATRVAASVGKAFAVLFAVWGFLTFNMLLVLIAFFVFIGAKGEARSVAAKELLGRLHVRDVMNGPVPSIPADLSVHEAAERMLGERRLAYAVTGGGRPAGFVTLQSIQAVPPERRAQVPVREVAVQSPPISPSDDLGKALGIMAETDAPLLAVVEGGVLVGLVTREDIARGLKLSELKSTQGQGAAWPMRRREA
ncbi:MAG TPA: site-2 protease family protein [Myxococcaceae bacterium]|jgi:Zn-dependent protease